FILDRNGQLNLAFKPYLPGWLFAKNGKYSFNFLSRILVTYHNPKRKNTFGKNAAKITKIILFENEQPREINSAVIPSSLAEKVRSRQISKIDIYLE
ncbi:MAG: hypothetical protein Q8K15_02645, partial [Candidatus Omnitrophota bacterium]|nr:hypothetical protein [Candidatus Omnitrophota bacterium]